MKKKINIDVSNPEICEIIEYYNELISEIIEIYENESKITGNNNNNNISSTWVPYVFKKTFLWRTIRYIKYNGYKNTFKKIKTELVGGANENIRNK